MLSLALLATFSYNPSSTEVRFLSIQPFPPFDTNLQPSVWLQHPAAMAPKLSLKTAPVPLHNIGYLLMVKFVSLGICVSTFPAVVPLMEPNYKFGLAVTETSIKDGITLYVRYFFYATCITPVNSGGIIKFLSLTIVENVWIWPVAVKKTVTVYVSSIFTQENLTLPLDSNLGLRVQF